MVQAKATKRLVDMYRPSDGRINTYAIIVAPDARVSIGSDSAPSLSITIIRRVGVPLVLTPISHILSGLFPEDLTHPSKGKINTCGDARASPDIAIHNPSCLGYPVDLGVFLFYLHDLLVIRCRIVNV